MLVFEKQGKEEVRRLERKNRGKREVEKNGKKIKTKKVRRGGIIMENGQEREKSLREVET